MRITWIIPDTYGFLIDELEELAARGECLIVLSSMPVSAEVKERLPKVQFHYCPERSFLMACVKYPALRKIATLQGWLRTLRSGWHSKKIAGIYSVLFKLEAAASSDIIHSHFSHPGGVGGALLSGKKHLLTLRGYDILTTANYGSLWNPFYRKNLIHFFSKDVPVTVGSSRSQFVARQILGAKACIDFIPEGMTVDSFESSGELSRKDLGIPEEATVLVSVGNLVALKNVAMVVSCLADLQLRSAKPVHLVICGDGPEEIELRKLASSCKKNTVHFMGRVARADLSNLYQLSDILVHASLSEGFGNIIIEAFWHRLLVVASPVGVAADAIRHKENGFLCVLGDKESLTACVESAIQELPNMKRVLESNCAMVTEKYTIKHRVDAYITLYREVFELEEQ